LIIIPELFEKGKKLDYFTEIFMSLDTLEAL